MTDISLMDLNDIEDMPETLRGILKKHDIDVWKNGTMGRVYFVPLCRVIDILVQYEEMTTASQKMKAEIKKLERFEIRGEVTPLVNVDNVLQICDKYNVTD